MYFFLENHGSMFAVLILALVGGQGGTCLQLLVFSSTQTIHAADHRQTGSSEKCREKGLSTGIR